MDVTELIDAKAGTQSRRIFWDRDIYDQELERVFARCWLFLAHESQIPNPGDYVVTKMGEDEVIVWRQDDGAIKVFLNQCSHRGTRLCHAEAGSARGLSCIYHGWQFASDGNLKTVPMEKLAYGPEFDKSEWGLRELARVESYKGFVFGCMDAAAPTLLEYLGDEKWYFDIWTDVPGGIELLGPPARSILHTNWKTPAENFVGDIYHLGMTHGSILKASSAPMPDLSPGSGLQAATRYGHGKVIAFGGQLGLNMQISPDLREVMPDRTAEELPTDSTEAQAKLYTSQWAGTIFPNCSYLIGLNVFKVWHPIGPGKVEVVTWAIGEKRMSEEAKRRMKVAVHRTFGPAGVLESDDLDNFEYNTAPNRGYLTRQGKLNLLLGKGFTREDPEYPGVVSEMVSELSARGYYRFYADCLKSGNWDELQKNSANWKEQLLG